MWRPGCRVVACGEVANPAPCRGITETGTRRLQPKAPRSDAGRLDEHFKVGHADTDHPAHPLGGQLHAVDEPVHRAGCHREPACDLGGTDPLVVHRNPVGRVDAMVSSPRVVALSGMRKLIALLLAMTALALVGCSGDAEDAAEAETTTTTPPASSTTTTTIAPTTTLDPQRASQVAYFTIVSETNAAGDVIAKKYYEDGTPDLTWSEAPAWCREMATVQERYINLLSTTAWPAQYQPQVTDVIAKSSVYTQLLLECAETPGTASALSSVNERLVVADDESDAAVSTLRGVLGLPIER